MRKAIKTITYSLLTSVLASSSVSASLSTDQIPFDLSFSFTTDTTGQILAEKLEGLDHGRYAIEPNRLLRAIKNRDLVEQVAAGPITANVSVFLNREEYVTKQLLQAAQDLNTGDRVLNPDDLAKAITYVPAHGEPTVIDLINKYWIYGMKVHFADAVAKLAERGDPVARAFTGTDLVWDNFADKQSPDYIKGMYYLMYASACGISDADNSLGMFLSYENKTPMALTYLRMGTSFPHGHTNLGCIEEDSTGAQQMLKDFQEAMKQGDPCAATAIADYYAKPGATQDLEKALTHYLISYHGYTTMDPFIGLGRILDFVRTTNFNKGVAARAKDTAIKWVTSNRKILGDGFDQTRATATPPGDKSEPQGTQAEENSVQGIFWADYAVGDKESFSKHLQKYLDKKDANAFYMAGHLARGFVGDPDPQIRRQYLDKAFSKSKHPGAALALAIDLIIDGCLTEKVTKKKNKLTRAYNVLMDARKAWWDTIYRDSVSEVTFLAGYMLETGLVTTNPKPVEAKKLYEQVKHLTPLAMGRLANLMIVKNPKTSADRAKNVIAYGNLLASIPRFVTGDWFGGIRPMQGLMNKLTTTEQQQARKLADQIVMRYDQISWNQYQRMFVSIYPAFSGLDEDN